MISAIVFLPLLAAAIAGLSCRVIPVRLAQFITCGCLLLAATLSGFVFADIVGGTSAMRVVVLPWIASGDFTIDWALRVDALTAVMLVVVTWVSSVVHLYSVGYMSHDPHPQRFMAYLSLFTFCMLMLVTADNFIQLFFGWEGVGLASYLLIGFWFQKDSANAAAMKAFVVNRVGDFGLILGIAAIFLTFGSVQFDAVFAAAASAENSTLSFWGMELDSLTIITMLLFIGAMGKSAQIGLHTWLPDAMEGPTPVSALIHAATMVTAGVFLVARCSPMFELAPTTLMVVTVIGAITAFFAATIGLVQNDIKKVIAYSTCSQLGYMFFACGVGAYPAAVFHLMTHAFFKALLFLGAGSVIHAVEDEQDMRNMGGLRKKLPLTYIYMWIGSLALAGLPWFAGYYSKDMILESAWAAGSSVGEFAYWVGIAAAFMTAFYSWRLIFMTFHGEPRMPKERFDHAHEAPAMMNVPLILLAAGALFSGILGYSWLGMVDADNAFWNGSIYLAASNNVLELAHHVPLWVKKMPIMVGVPAILLAFIFYVKKTDLPAKVATLCKPLYVLFVNKWYFDELYNWLFVRGAQRKGLILWRFGDVRIIDGLGPNGFAKMVALGARGLSQLQTGYLYHYAFIMLLALGGMLVWLYRLVG